MLAHEVGLVEDEHVGEGDLRLALARVLEVQVHVLGVDERHDTVQREEIAKLVIRFIDAYASTGRPADLVYFVAPGSEVTPLGGFDLVGEPDVAQLDDGETQRTVTARVRLKDQATGVVYPLRYRLELVRRQRWFVAGVQGTSR